MSELIRQHSLFAPPSYERLAQEALLNILFAESNRRYKAVREQRQLDSTKDYEPQYRVVRALNTAFDELTYALANE
jgi:hypothetical protein